MKCDKCLKPIVENEVYFEFQEWEMEDQEGHECGDTRICSNCYFEVKKFLTPS